jgi:iron(III) transport system permease protein
MRGDTAGRMAIGGLVALVAFLSLYPLGWLVYGSFASAPPFSMQEARLTLGNYISAYSDPVLLRTAWNTLVFAGGQTVFAVALGTALAWIVARTNTPGRRVFEVLVLSLFLMPLLLAVIAWTMILSPQRGILNALLVATFGLAAAPFDIYSLGGMVFVQGLYLTPLAFLMIAPSFRAIDSSLEEAARTAGAGTAQILFRVTLPLAAPAIWSSAILIFVLGLESFDVPQMLGASRGIYTYTSLIFYQINERYPADYGVGAALAVSLLLFSLACVAFYRWLTRDASRYETVRGKSYRPERIDLGRWRFVTSAACWAFFGVAVLLPVGVLLLGSFLQYYGSFDAGIFSRMSMLNYERVLTHPTLLRGFANSVLLGVVAGAACVLLATVVSFVVIRTRLPGRGVLEGIAALPIAFPGTVLGLALLWGWIGVPLPIYGTLLIIGLAYVTRFLPIALRTLSGGMMQIGVELEEAGRIAGATLPQRLLFILAPLLRPSLFAAWLILFMIFIRELPMSLLLASSGSPVLAVVMFDFYQSGELGALSAASVLIIALVAAVVVVARGAVDRGAGH